MGEKLCYVGSHRKKVMFENEKNIYLFRELFLRAILFPEKYLQNKNISSKNKISKKIQPVREMSEYRKQPENQ